MSMKPIAAACSSIVVALAGALGLVAETHAARYTGTFDPRGDVYGFEGTHSFEVDDACLSSSGWKAVNESFYVGGDTYTKCGNATLTGGTLTLRKFASAAKDINENYTNNTVILEETFPFSGGLGLPLSAGIWGIYVGLDENEDLNLMGVDTDILGRINPDGSPFDGLYWWLRWESGEAPIGSRTSTGDPVFLYSAICNDSGCGVPTLADVPTATPRFDRVPEPGALALTLLALAAMGGVSGAARRRAAARPPR